MKHLEQLDLNNKRILIRADLNVPIDEQGGISDLNRLKQFLPTLNYIMERGGRPIVMSHLGDDGTNSLKPVADKLAEFTGKQVIFATDCIGPEVESLVEQLQPQQILLLENLRKHSGEKNNDLEFAQGLARLGDVFISDAFATAHRKHASMVSVPKLFKERAPGLLMQKEIEYYERALVSPAPPLCFVLGGAKIKTKLPILLNIADKADKLIIGGAMANTFLAAQGLQMGRSLFEPELFGKALEILGMLARRDAKVYLPVDFMVSTSTTTKGLARAVPALEVPADSMALDIGPATSLLYREALQTAGTIVWNGPMGYYENEDFAKGTTDLVESIAAAHGISIAGGGDTDSVIHQMELSHKFNFISTGGGAFLALLEGGALPGIESLK